MNDLGISFEIAYSKVSLWKDDGEIVTNLESDRSMEQPTDSVHPLE
jgi:hypothetical protein